MTGTGGGEELPPPPSAAGGAGGARLAARLRRDLGTLEAYAALIGVLVGAGIFSVTSRAYELTGPSLLLGHLLLAPLVLATSVAYAVLLSTPLGTEPGGEYGHFKSLFGGRALAFCAAWLKLISYVGAAAYLASALADYLLELARLCGLDVAAGQGLRLAIALAGLALFFGVHVSGARWYGRLQVGMCAVLGLSIVVLVVPGLFAVRAENYAPFFTGGASGFALALSPLFFAYAGFETLAHTAGEVEDSRRRLPRVFLKGVALTSAVFLAMSVVAFGVLPGARLAASSAPMAEVAGVYLPAGGAALVAVGGVMAVATSLNATLFGPARIALVLAEDGLVPDFLGRVDARRGTPVIGLTATAAAAVLLLVSGQLSLALNVAVLALVILYGIHSFALLVLPRRRPDLYAQVTVGVPRRLQVASALLSVAGMAAIVAVQAVADLATVRTTTFAERWSAQSLTGTELLVDWAVVGLAVFALRVRRA